MPDAPKQDAEEGAPAWMLTFGDMTTLILTFFVLLITMMTIDPKKYLEILGSRPGLDGAGYDRETETVDTPTQNTYIQIMKVATRRNADSQGGIPGGAEGDAFTFFSFDENYVAQIAEEPFFPPFEIILSEGAKARLKRVATQVLATGSSKIRMIGHFANMEGNFEQIQESVRGSSSQHDLQGVFRPFERWHPDSKQLMREMVLLNSPRDLATYRALAVEEFLVAHGVDRYRMEATAGQQISNLARQGGGSVVTRKWVPNAAGGGKWVTGTTTVHEGAAEAESVPLPKPAKKDDPMIRSWNHFIFTEGGDDRGRTVEIVVTGELASISDVFAPAKSSK